MPGNAAHEPLEPRAFHPPHPPQPSATTLFFRVLGPVRAERAGSSLHLGRLQARTVLALLILARGEVVSIDRLVDAIWGDVPPSSARVQLQGHISFLRRALGARCASDPASPILTTPSGYRLHLNDGGLDLDLFRNTLTQARRHLIGGDANRASEQLRDALALWHGEPFADITAAAVRDVAEPLAELRLAAVQDRIEADLASGQHSHLVPEIRQLTAEHPFRERFWLQLMTALAHAGRTAEALAAYREVWRLLDSELGIAPSRELQHLQQAILKRETLLTA